MRDVQAPEGRVRVAVVYPAGVLHGADEECGGVPGRARIERFKAFETKGYVGSSPCRDQATRTQAHPEAAPTEGEAFVGSEVRDHIGKGKLQIELVLLHRRGGLRL